MGRKVYSDADEAQGAATGASAQEENTAVPPPQLDGGTIGVPDGNAPVEGVTTAMSDRVFQPVTAARFTVLSDARINGVGGITWLKAGQTVDENGYDIDGLKRQGVRLAPQE